MEFRRASSLYYVRLSQSSNIFVLVTGSKAVIDGSAEVQWFKSGRSPLGSYETTERQTGMAFDLGKPNCERKEVVISYH